jgi:isopentenyl phosphate kinase
MQQLHGNRADDAVLERIVILKLGGSSITDKGSLETLNQGMLDWIASTLSNNTDVCYSTDNEDQYLTIRNRFIIVHGAGSFGHQVAKKYGLKGGYIAKDDNYDGDTTNIDFLMEGLAQTRLSVTKLNWHVVQTLLKHSLPAVGISPFAVGLQAHGDPLLFQNLGDFNIEADPMQTLMYVITSSLQVGLTPVLHGDAVLYGRQRSGILSGDTLISQISVRPEWKVSPPGGDGHYISKNPTFMLDVVFLTDVDGVYTTDPKIDKNAKLIPLIEVDVDGNIVSTGTDEEGPDTHLCSSIESSSSSCSSIHEHDVTGGLRTKLQSAIDIAKTGIPVYILKCGSSDATNVLRGQNTLDHGTLIKLQATETS